MFNLFLRLMLYVNSNVVKDGNYYIAVKILENLHVLPDMKIEEAAAVCLTSPATLSRFCTKFGYTNFQKFKKELKSDLDEFREVYGVFQYDEIRPEEMKHTYLKSITGSVGMLNETIDMDVIDKVAKEIGKKSTIAILGSYSAQIICYDFLLKLLLTGGKKPVIIDKQAAQSEEIDAGNCLFILPYLAEEFKQKDRASNVKNKKMKGQGKNLLITMCNDPELVASYDYVIHLPVYNHDKYFKAIFGKLNLMSVLDLIYSRYDVLFKSGNQ